MNTNLADAIPDLEIPAGYSTSYSANSYVPWNPSILSDYKNHISGSVGSSVNVGIPILAAIMGILVVIKIIKMFIK